MGCPMGPEPPTLTLRKAAAMFPSPTWGRFPTMGSAGGPGGERWRLRPPPSQQRRTNRASRSSSSSHESHGASMGLQGGRLGSMGHWGQ